MPATPGPTDLALCGPGGRIQTQIDLGPPFRTLKRCVYGETAAVMGPKIRARGGGWRKATPGELALMRRSQRRRTPQSNELARMNQLRMAQAVTGYGVGSVLVRRYDGYSAGRRRAYRVLSARLYR